MPLFPFFQPATTCDPSEGPIRVARPMPWRAAATPWPDWSTGRIHGHSRFKTPDRIVYLQMRLIPRVSLRSVLRAAPACSSGAVFSEQERMEQWNSLHRIYIQAASHVASWTFNQIPWVVLRIIPVTFRTASRAGTCSYLTLYVFFSCVSSISWFPLLAFFLPFDPP